MSEEGFTEKQIEAAWKRVVAKDDAFDYSDLIAELTRTPWMPALGETYLYQYKSSGWQVSRCAGPPRKAGNDYEFRALSDTEIPYYKVLREALELITAYPGPAFHSKRDIAKKALDKAAAMRGETHE